MNKFVSTAWSCLKQLLTLSLVIFCGWLAVSCVRATNEAQAKLDKIYDECPAVARTCSVEKTQMAKFAHITRYDYEQHTCKDGRSVTKRVRQTTLESTYKLYHVDLNRDVKKLALEQGCEAR